MFSFVVNAVAVLAGSIIGVLFRKFIKKETCNAVLKAMGIVLLMMGVANTIKYMITITGSTFEIDGTLVLILCITVGTFIGEIIKIDAGFNKFGLFVEKKINKGQIVDGFITATLVYCVGSMAIIGTFDAVNGDSSTIYLKSALDGISSIAFASTLGFGVALSSISVLIYQGLLTVLFWLIGSVLPEELINLINLVGYILIIAIGFNFVTDSKIKVANMLPSLIIVIIYYYLKLAFNF